jgi:hypothetical protein
VPSISPTVIGATLAPSLSIYQRWSAAGSGVATVLSASRREIYYDVTVSTSLIVGSCSLYSIFTENKLLKSVFNERARNISIFSHSSLDGGATVMEAHCSDTAVLGTIVERLSGTGLYVHLCGGRTWTVGQCPDGSDVLCVDCVNACAVNHSKSGIGQGFSWKPCVAADSDSIRVLAVDFEDVVPVPGIIAVTMAPLQTALNVSVTLSSDGYVSCGVFTVHTVPSSIQVVVLQNFFVATSRQSAYVLIDGLTASTNYSVYCLAHSTTAKTTSYADMLNTNLVASTSCCKTVSVFIRKLSVLAATVTSEAFEISLSGLPQYSLSVTLLGSRGGMVVPSSSLFYPSTLSIPSSGQQTHSIYILSNEPGTYRVSVAIAGPSASEYEVVYANGMFINITDGDSPSPPPVVLGAVFSSSGESLIVRFSTPSNNGGLSGVFKCSLLLDFGAASSSSCQWLGFFDLVISLPGSSALVPGSSVTLLGGKIRSACVSPRSCSEGRALGATAVLLLPPAAPAAPKVIISTSSLIGQCADMDVDYSASSGSGGRAWRRINVAVSSESPNITQVREFVAQQLLSFPSRISIPHGLLESRYTYRWSVKLCNFLGACGVAIRVVGVTTSEVPIVRMLGQLVKNVFRNSSFSLSLSAYVPTCGGGTSTRGLRYSWTAFESSSGSTVASTLKSSSKDVRTFLVQPYLAMSGVTYTLVGTVLNTASGLSATTSAFVLVDRGELTSLISGGSEQSFRAGETFTLDGSLSSDKDLEINTGVEFEWSCIQLKPVFSDESCGVIFLGSRFEATASVRSTSLNDTSQSEIVLTVTGNGGDSVSTTVVLNVVVQSSSLVKITSSTKKVNPDQKLTISALLSSTNSGVAEWSVADSSVSLSEFARTALRVDFEEGALLVPTTIHLVLDPHALYGRGLFTFKLTFVAGPEESVSALTIVTNGEPRIGSLVVSPAAGVMLATLFSLTAEHWEDEDLPLMYAFGFAETFGVNVFDTIRTKAELAFCSAFLPRGSPQADFNLTIRVRVYDFYDAMSSATAPVAVIAAPIVIGDLMSEFAEALNDTSANGAEDRGLVALLGSVLNAADCSDAPDCSALNRKFCSSEKNTCGPCGEGYFGDDGYANTLCVVELTTDSLGANCSADADCGPWAECAVGACIPSAKTCPGNCSSHGVCGFYSTVRLNARPASCLVGDLTCEAKCNCSSLYAGSACSDTKLDFDAKRDLRESLVRKMLLIMENENVDEETVASWIQTLVSLSSVSEALSRTTKTLLALATRRALQAALQAEVQFRYVSDIVIVIEAVQWAEAGTEEVAESVELVSELISLYTELVRIQLLSGEVPQESLTSLFTVVTQIADFTDNSGVILSSPLSAFEKALGLKPQSLTVVGGERRLQEGARIKASASSASDASRQSAGVSLISTKSKLFNDPYFNSDIIRLIFPESLCDSASCTVVMTIQHAAPVDSSAAMVLLPAGGEANDYVTNFSTVCELSKPSNTSYACPDGSRPHLSCNGSWAGALSMACPLRYGVSVCNSLAGSAVVRNNCSVLSYTAHYTTCQCSLGEVYGALQAAAGGGGGSNSTQAAVAFVAMLDYTVTEFAATWRSADSLDEDSVRESWRVLVTIGVVCFIAVTATLGGEYVDQKHQTVKNAEKSAAKAAGSSAVDIELSADDLVEESLPNVLREKPFTEKFKREIKIYHKWAGVIFTYSTQVSRAVRILSLLTAAVIMLFANAITYNLGYPDDGSCGSYETAAACLQEQSSFSGSSKCYWSAHAEGYECAFREPADDMRMVIYTAIIAAIMSTPIAVFADYIIMNNIALETSTNKKPAVKQFGSNGQRLKANRIANIPSDEAAIGGRMKRHLAVVPEANGGALGGGVEGSLSTTLQEDISSLMAEIRAFRSTLGPSDLQQFDDMWALDGDGTFISEHSMDGSAASNMLRALLRVRAPNVHRAVTLDIWKVRKSLAREKALLEGVDDEKKIGQRLMFLFQKDLLPGVNAMILESKGQRDFVGGAGTVDFNKKAMAWTFIGLLNVSLIFYIYLFSLRQTGKRQEAWFRTFIVWLILEVFVMSTFVVLVMHILIPMLTMRDLHHVKRRLKLTIVDYLADIRGQAASSGGGGGRAAQGGDRMNGAHAFNVAEYLFVSTRLCTFYSGLKEAQIIQRFSTPWPHQSYRRTKSLSTGYRKRFSTLFQGFTLILVFFLKGILVMPSNVQDMLLSICTVVVVGNILSYSVQLYNVNPALGVLPFVALVMLLAISVASCFSSKGRGESANSVSQVSPDPRSEADADDGVQELDPAVDVEGGGGARVATRRQSVVQGLAIARELHQQQQQQQQQQLAKPPPVAVAAYDASDAAMARAPAADPLSLAALYTVSDDDNSDDDVADIAMIRGPRPTPQWQQEMSVLSAAPPPAAPASAPAAAAAVRGHLMSIDDFFQVSDDEDEDKK